MKIFFPLFLGLIGFVFQDCGPDKASFIPDNNEITDRFKDGYFIYTTDKKTYPIYLNLSEIFISFSRDSLGKDDITGILTQYNIIPPDSFYVLGYTRKTTIKIENEDSSYYNHLLIRLNKDPEIEFACPVFTHKYPPDVPGPGCPEDYFIAIDEIFCKPVVSEAEFYREVYNFNLSVIQKKSDYCLLKINDIETGYEPIEIAAGLYETGKFEWSQPNGYSAVCLL